MNNARRFLSKGSTLLRGIWSWSEKLRWYFVAVERVRNPKKITQKRELGKDKW